MRRRPHGQVARFGLAWLVQILDLTANRLRSLEPNLLALTGLRRLCLRQNLLSEGAEVEALASAPGGAAAEALLSQCAPACMYCVLECQLARALQRVEAKGGPLPSASQAPQTCAPPTACVTACPPHPLTQPHPAPPYKTPLPCAVLEALDLRDNQFKALPSLQAFTALQSLEMSYNEVGGEEGLAGGGWWVAGGGWRVADEGACQCVWW